MTATAAGLNRGVAAVSAALEPLVGRLEAPVAVALRDLAAVCAASLDGLVAAGWEGPSPEQLTAELRQRHDEAWRARHEPKVERVQVEAMRRTYREMGQAIGVDLALTNPVIEGQVRKLRNRSTLPASAWEVVRESLQRSQDAGEGIPQAARRLRTDVAAIAPARGRMIARTELVSIANRGSLTAARIAGVGGFKTWLATNDARTRNAHALANGQTVPLDDTFSVMGEPLDYPGDPIGSPANIIHCRCTVTYADTAAGFTGEVAEPVGTELGPVPVLEEAPAGRPITDGILNVMSTAKRRREVDDVFERIGEVHTLPPDTPDVWELKVFEGRHNARGTAGVYRRTRTSAGMVPERIQVNSQRSPLPSFDPRTVTAHEYGHHLDHWYLRSGDDSLDRDNFASEDFEARAILEAEGLTPQGRAAFGLDTPLSPYGEAFVEFFRQVYATDTWRRLQVVEGEHGRYMRSGREVWARAYSQWVGRRTDDAAINAGHAQSVTRRSPDLDKWGTGLGSWPPREFDAIADAIDDLFRKAGMMPDA